MLSLAKLAGSNQRYYLDQTQRRVDHTESVASGVEDYYLSGPEAAGQWTGSAADALGLEGRVSEAQLRAVLSKHDPRTGRALDGSVRRARVPGFDLMFSVPKSASILFGVGDPVVQRAVLDAQAAAVGEALVYLERHACRTRRGAGGFEIVPGDGFVGAAFRHRTSRAGDPQVHTHVLVANATRIGDGTWGSLDGRALYAEARTAGYVHEAAFRRELTLRLGVEWTKARNGIAEVQGVARPVIDAFSRRRAEIEAQVEAWGRDTAAARQSAALQTRSRKDYDVTPDQLVPEWRVRAGGLGLTPERIDQMARSAGRTPAPADFRAIREALLSPTGLTGRRSSFDRRDVVRGFAEAARDGTTLREIDKFIGGFLASPEVVPLTEPGAKLRREDVIRRRDGRRVSAVADSPRYSTAELLAIEQRILDEATSVVAADTGTADPAETHAALASRVTIGPDQAEMVTRLCRDGAPLQVVVGPPGTGKTFALDAAREAWERSGFTVRGAAVARRAAMELAASSGIDATSVAALLADLRQVPSEIVDDRTVLVIDEAAMLGTRALDEIFGHTRRAGAKLVLVGDHEQLPEIDAGGAFRALAARTNAIRLDVNRRQERDRDRRLLERWRSGELREALTIAVAGGDLCLTGTAEETYERIVADYCAAAASGEDAVMLAPRRAEVGRLNRLARETLMQVGRVERGGMDVQGRTFAPGDRVVLRRNDRCLCVENGTRGTVLAVDAASGDMTIALSDGTRRSLPSAYLERRTEHGGASVEHGYALTAHLAQGMTTDRAFVFGSESVYREWGYVAWSRARRRTRFYALEPEISDEHHNAAPSKTDRFDELVRRLDRSEGQRVASNAVADRRARAARHGTSSYLDRVLGPRPDRFWKRRRWDRAAKRIERFRAKHAIDDHIDALGPQPRRPADRAEWRRAAQDISRFRLEAGLPRQERDDVGRTAGY